MMWGPKLLALATAVAAASLPSRNATIIARDRKLIGEDCNPGHAYCKQITTPFQYYPTTVWWTITKFRAWSAYIGYCLDVSGSDCRFELEIEYSPSNDEACLESNTWGVSNVDFDGWYLNTNDIRIQNYYATGSSCGTNTFFGSTPTAHSFCTISDSAFTFKAQMAYNSTEDDANENCCYDFIGGIEHHDNWVRVGKSLQIRPDGDCKIQEVDGVRLRLRNYHENPECSSY